MKTKTILKTKIALEMKTILKTKTILRVETDRPNKYHCLDEPIRYLRPPGPSLDREIEAIKEHSISRIVTNLLEDRWEAHQNPY